MEIFSLSGVLARNFRGPEVYFNCLETVDHRGYEVNLRLLETNAEYIIHIPLNRSFIGKSTPEELVKFVYTAIQDMHPRLQIEANKKAIKEMLKVNV